MPHTQKPKTTEVQTAQAVDPAAICSLSCGRILHRWATLRCGKCSDRMFGFWCWVLDRIESVFGEPPENAAFHALVDVWCEMDRDEDTPNTLDMAEEINTQKPDSEADDHPSPDCSAWWMYDNHTFQKVDLTEPDWREYVMCCYDIDGFGSFFVRESPSGKPIIALHGNGKNGRETFATALTAWTLPTASTKL